MIDGVVPGTPLPRISLIKKVRNQLILINYFENSEEKYGDCRTNNGGIIKSPLPHHTEIIINLDQSIK